MKKRQREGIPPHMRKAIYYIYNGKCAVCGYRDDGTAADESKQHPTAHGNAIHHVVPVCQGGGTCIDNLILICPNHHRQVHSGKIDVSNLVINSKEAVRVLCEKDPITARILYHLTNTRRRGFTPTVRMQTNFLKRRIDTSYMGIDVFLEHDRHDKATGNETYIPVARIKIL